MKKISFLIGMVLLVACANPEIDLLKKSVSELNKQNIELKKDIAEVKSKLSETDRRLQTNIEDTKLNSEALITLKSDLKSLENRVHERLKSLDQSKSTKTDTNQPKVQVSADSNKVYIDDDIADKTTLYNIALELYKSGRYDESLSKFRSFVVRFPSDSLADNALYWMGEIYIQLGDFEKAYDSFKNVFENYPTENKVPDAMYKAAITLDKLNKRDEAVDLLKKVILNFQYSEVSKFAKDKLKEWGIANE